VLLAVIVIVVLASSIVVGMLALQPQPSSDEDPVDAKVAEYAHSFSDASVQQAVKDGFAQNGNTPNEDGFQIDFLKTYPQSVQMEFIVNGSAYDTDWDKDHFPNRIDEMPRVYNGRNAIIAITDDPSVYKDLTKLEDFLLNNEHFDPSEITALYFKEATKENFDKACSEVSKKSGPNDILYVFLDGHGSEGSDGNGGIFGFNDGKGGNQGPEGLARYKDIALEIDKINAGKKFISVNACNCETSLDDLGNKDNTVVVAYLDGSYVYQIKYALDPHNLSKFPTNIDTDGNGFTSVGELAEFAKEKQGNYLLTISDKGNIAQTLYFGDFNVHDRAK
jgi:hypothetical protein